MTSSDVFPAGISWAVTSSLGCAAFHAFTMSLPQATSSVLLDSQTLIGPRAACAAEPPEAPEPPEPPQAAVVAIARVSTAAEPILFFIGTPFGRGSARIGDGPCWVRARRDDVEARWTQG